MKERLETILQERILVLDGAMGTMIQRYGLDESGYRGDRFADWGQDVMGNNDLLSLTQPGIIRTIHKQYLQVGADIIETNTFNAQAISLADYGMQALAYEINLASAQIARRAADEFTAKTPSKPRFVAGSIGPTNRTASMSPDVEDPGFRAVDYDQLLSAYSDQIHGLQDGGVDIFLVETVFDTLNAKAALHAILQLREQTGVHIPVIVSGTITDKSGRTLSGQLLEAFLHSISHVDLLAVGLNCALGATEMRQHVQRLSALTGFFTISYPNAGLPNAFGEYDETPEKMRQHIDDFLSNGWVNIIGGCCGTTPEHIALFAQSAAEHSPRKAPSIPRTTRLSGLESLTITPEINFVNIGERTNVAGSRKFARLIRNQQYAEAVQIAAQQVENGAQIVDICMDDAMLDAPHEMRTFLHLLASEPDICRVPFMVDSSDWEVILAGIKCIQGKPIINSISLKEGEEVLLEKANQIRKFGAAVVVMAFDEDGQADTLERKIEICSKSYHLLTGHGFPPEDIIFDPNILAIGTGIEEHARYAIDFIEACRWIKAHLPHAKVSGGVSNLSFAFRGQNEIREAIHSAFLYHAIQAGLDMAIVNPAQLQVYDDIPKELLTLVEDLIFNRNPGATDALLRYAAQHKGQSATQSVSEDWRQLPLDKRLGHALVKGITTYLESDVAEAIAAYPSALAIIEGPLMDGMNIVGQLFGSGKMFLPQVVKSARVMKKAVAILLPILQAEQSGTGTKAGKILLATVKGDVHDIGKNIVGVVLSCNNFEVIDLGVMVPTEEIIRVALEEKVDLIGLSGLITPSLKEMALFAGQMEQQGLSIPILIGGATTSDIHTAVKIAPEYSAPVLYVRDAPTAVRMASALLGEDSAAFVKEAEKQHRSLVEKHRLKNASKKLRPLDEARRRRFGWNRQEAQIKRPARLGRYEMVDIPISSIIPFIDWTFFFYGWQLKGKFPAILEHPEKGEEAQKLYRDALDMLKKIETRKWLRASAVYGLYEASSQDERITISYRDKTLPLVFLRNQSERLSVNPCLSDYIAPADSGVTDYLGLFAVTAGLGMEEALEDPYFANDEYRRIMLKLLADRLAEALAEKLHYEVRTQFWGYSPEEGADLTHLLKEKYRGIRPAAGYPACPDHSEKVKIFEWMEVTSRLGISLTDSYAMHPAASVSGYYFAHPKARYFKVGAIGRDQAEAYAGMKSLTVEEIKDLLPDNIHF